MLYIIVCCVVCVLLCSSLIVVVCVVVCGVVVGVVMGGLGGATMAAWTSLVSLPWVIAGDGGNSLSAGVSVARLTGWLAPGLVLRR